MRLRGSVFFGRPLAAFPQTLQASEMIVWHGQMRLEIGGRCLVQVGLSKWSTGRIEAWMMDGVTVRFDPPKAIPVMLLPWSRIYDNSDLNYQIAPNVWGLAPEWQCEDEADDQ